MEIYDKLVVKCPRFERKGKTMPCTIANGYMFSLLNKTGEIGFRFSKQEQLKHRVYVIELSKKVFTENAKFRAMNPQFNGVLECLYVGMTSKTPEQRFKQHITGYRNRKGVKLSSSIVRKYGKFLRPSLYKHLDLMTRSEALKMEENLALELRRQRYAVWYN